jgi:hypothetical protein
MGLTLIYIGGLLALIGWIWLVVMAFGDSILWGILSLFPILALIWGLIHFKTARNPTLLLIVGAVLQIVGQSMGVPIVVITR